MRNKFIVLGMIALAGGAGITSAQSPQPESQQQQTLTLQQAEALALKNHPQIQSAQFAALASAQTVREEASAYYPTLFGSVTGSVADQGTRIGAGFLTDSRLFNRFGQGITFDQLITDSGRTSNLVASSKLQARAAQESVQSTRYDVLLLVNLAFFGVLRAQALETVAEKTVAERQVVADQVTALVNNKLKSNLDLSFAQVNLAQAKLLLITTQNNVNKAFAQLTRALGSQNQQVYALQDEPLPPGPPSSSDALVAQAMTQRPELVGLDYDRESAYKFQKAERDLALPTVEAMGVAGYTPIIAGANIPDHYEAAAININIPIFNGHEFAARRAAAMMRARAADQDLRNEQDKIAQDVRSAWADSMTSYQQIDVANQMLNQAKLALTLAQGRYNLGLSSIVELNQAQLGETEAEIQDVNAKYDYQSQNAALQYQTGSLR